MLFQLASVCRQAPTNSINTATSTTTQQMRRRIGTKRGISASENSDNCRCSPRRRATAAPSMTTQTNHRRDSSIVTRSPLEKP